MHRGGQTALAFLVAGVVVLATAHTAVARTAYFTGALPEGAEPYAQPIELTTGALGGALPFPGEGEPNAVAITPDGTTAYVVDQFGEGILPIDVATNTPGAEIPTGLEPTAIAIAPDGSSAYVADRAGFLLKVDLASSTVVGTIPLGGEPKGVAVSPDGSTAYVTGTGAKSVTPIDLATETPGTPIEVGEDPTGIGVAPDGSAAYVTNRNDDDVSRIDLAGGTVTKTIPVENSPEAIAVTPDSSHAYVVGSNSPITPIDLAAGAAETPIEVSGQGDYLEGVAILPDGSRAYVTDNSTGEILPIDTATNALEAALTRERQAEGDRDRPQPGSGRLVHAHPPVDHPGDRGRARRHRLQRLGRDRRPLRLGLRRRLERAERRPAAEPRLRRGRHLHGDPDRHRQRRLLDDDRLPRPDRLLQRLGRGDHHSAGRRRLAGDAGDADP